jgi:glycosyltransferase involved in cell wall biosynthesis
VGGGNTPSLLFFMKTNKLKILFSSEASFINSGFGNYTKELLTRLFSLNKYEIAEFASYGFVNDPRDGNIRWKYYANAVREEDPRYKEYMSRSDNQFGRWRFDKVVIDFKPHVNVDIRDFWMNYYQSLSPTRPFFNWVLMPTVDSAPQQEQWIDTFLGADAIFTYSDWAANVLKKQSNNKINYIDTTSPGVDLNTFKPILEKQLLRDKYNIPRDAFVIGTVMRNQKRKLFPELISSVRSLIDRLQAENSPYANKIYLYLHTSYPDAGWDIPELLKEHRLSNRTIITYKCAKCGHVECSTFKHPVKICKKCFNVSSKFSSVSNGVDNETLAEIYNLFDIYVQYSICEGFGLPQIEAGACGIPVATVNYSAMEDVVDKLEAYPISIETYFKELETKAIRVYPSNKSLIDILHKHINLDNNSKTQKAKRIRELTAKYYCWDKIAEKWESFFDSEWLFTTKRNWSDSSKILEKCSDPNSKNILLNIINACSNSLKNTREISTLKILDMCKDAGYGFIQSGTSINQFQYNDLINNINAIVNNHNQLEYVRSNNISFDDDYIRYSHLKDTL